MSRSDHAADRVLSFTLKAGAYTAFGLIVLGLLLQGTRGLNFSTAGLLVLLVTPLIRIAVAGVQFLRERDFKYALVSLGVLAIVVLAYVLGIQT